VSSFRFGLHAFASPAHDEWVELARRAEGDGFSAFTMPDHLLEGCLPPFAALGVAAEATSTLRLGTLVLNNELRHPALAAREALALDALSGGRFELGVGAGSAMSGPEFESIGMDYGTAATRVARLAEALDIMDGLLRGDAVTVSGDHYRLDAFRAWPPPTQTPRLPIVVGGGGRRVLRLAGAHADVVALSGLGRAKVEDDRHEVSGFTPAAVDAQVEAVRSASTGRKVELQVLVQAVVVTEDARAAAEEIRVRLPELTVDDVLATPYVWVGSVESICEQAVEARERWGITYFSIFEHSLDAAAPIVGRLAGT